MNELLQEPETDDIWNDLPGSLPFRGGTRALRACAVPGTAGVPHGTAGRSRTRLAPWCSLAQEAMPGLVAWPPAPPWLLHGALRSSRGHHPWSPRSGAFTQRGCGAGVRGSSPGHRWVPCPSVCWYGAVALGTGALPPPCNHLLCV